jgi:hypothetical protein
MGNLGVPELTPRGRVAVRLLVLAVVLAAAVLIAMVGQPLALAGLVAVLAATRKLLPVISGGADHDPR